MNKTPMKAFLLSFIPGLGHYYVGRKVRPFIYAAGFFIPAALNVFILLMAIAGANPDKTMFFFFLRVGAAVWLINLADILLFLVRRTVDQWPSVKGRGVLSSNMVQAGLEESSAARAYLTAEQSSERFKTILLAFVPGVGHFHLGLMNRGAAFLLSFFGLFTMVIFLAFSVFGNHFLVFLMALPAIWLYNLFDAAQLLRRKQMGEELSDRTIFEELEANRQEGRKSKSIALILAVFPGAGHMYLGLQRRGLQLMAAFLLTVYMLDVLHLSLFLFLVPILWFYGFFDAMKHISRKDNEELKDVPLVDWLMNHQKWIGIGLLCLGAYYLFDQLIAGLLQDYFPGLRLQYWFYRYFQTFVVGTLLIGGGIRLLAGSKRRQ